MKFRNWVIFSFAVVTLTHFVRADGRFLFSSNSSSEFIRVARVHPANGSEPRFRFSVCHGDSECGVIGRKEGYTVEDFRIPLFHLQDQRENGKLTTSESRDLDTLQEIISGIEQPKPLSPQPGYSYAFKGSSEQFVRVLERRVSLE